MARLMSLLAASALLVAPPGALAGLTPAEQAQIDALPLDEICSATGSLGLRFGASDHGLTLNEHHSAERQLDARFLPFTSARMAFGENSSHFYYARLAAPVSDVYAAAARISERFKAAGWHSAPDLDFGYFGKYGFLNYGEGPASPEVRFYSAAPVAADQAMTTSQPVVSLATQRYGEEVGLFCQSIMHDLWAEVEKTQPRPETLVLPDIPPPLATSGFNGDDCDEPAKRNAIQSELRGAAQLTTSVRASEAAADWKRALLIASGKTTAAALDAQLNPLFERYYADKADHRADWSALAYFGVTSQPREYCEVALDISAEANAIVVAAKAGLTAIHALLNAEAARLGVEISKPK